jgi:hypothetical protein
VVSARRSTARTRASNSRISNGGHVVVGTELEADDPVDRVARGREHHQADPRMRLAHPACQRQAVLAGMLMPRMASAG